MHFLPLASLLLSGSLTLATEKIILSNDDGWATAQIRAQFQALDAANYTVVLSAPALDKSGTGSITTIPVPLIVPCQFNSCSAGSPAVGFNASDPRLNYVNGFPVDSVKHAIGTLAPTFFNFTPPEFVVSGPNSGLNTGLAVLGSGTVGAACEGAKQGFPSVALSGQGSAGLAWTTLDSDPTSSATLASRFNADLGTLVVNALAGSTVSPPIPEGVALNINFPARNEATGCSNATDVKWVLARTLPALLPLDVHICGNGRRLPVDGKVVHAGCFASVVAIDALLKIDVLAGTQQKVLDSLGSSLDFVCLP